MGLFGSVFLILNEMVGVSQKDKFNCILFCFWPITAMLLALIIYYSDNWRLLWISLAIIQLISTVILFFKLLESPRYLIMYRNDFI
mmetsp:Transcript_7490/g.946  ORF Transcript_7490/g.946 Transcript_7490/m.946 type:complete len:86 (+) Transcript_7490:430-687(+)